jgi:cell division protein FtsX
VGLLGAAIALGLLSLVSGAVTDFMYGFFRILPLELGSLQRDVILLVVGTGFGVGVLGSWLSVRNYLTR